MAIQRDNDQKPETDEAVPGADASAPTGGVPAIVAGPAGAESEGVPTQLGAQRYVHAAFFVAGILIAFLSGKILGAIWSALTDWPAAVRAVPQLVTYQEEQRDTITLVAGAVIGIATVIQIYRRHAIRNWADEVASELSRVTWPTRDVVVNGTLVVVIASTIATVYVAILDRFWGFLTTLVYGA